MRFNISVASTALFSTWIFVENLGVLFDAGDGVSAVLGQKGRKVRHIFVTHADRDHVCGLLQLHQLNAANGFPRIFYPADCGSFPALADFVSRFDPQSGPATWKGLRPGDTIELEKGFSVLAQASDHVKSEGLCKALSFTICASRRVLRPEFRNLTGAGVAMKRKELGDDVVTEARVEKLLGYSGDASELNPAHWPSVKVLIQECTFLESDTTRRSHSNLPQVIAAATQLPLEALILLHFSARYSSAEIEGAIRKEADQCRPKFPIFAVYPGQPMTDVLGQNPAWKPAS